MKIIVILISGSLKYQKMIRVVNKKPINESPKDLFSMLPETRRLLVDFYRHFNQDLAQLLNEPKFLEWNS